MTTKRTQKSTAPQNSTIQPNKTADPNLSQSRSLVAILQDNELREHLEGKDERGQPLTSQFAIHTTSIDEEIRDQAAKLAQEPIQGSAEWWLGVKQMMSNLTIGILAAQGQQRTRVPGLKFRSSFRKAICIQLRKNSYATDFEIVCGLDEDGEVPPWKTSASDRTFTDAYRNVKYKDRIHTAISQVRGKMRQNGLL